MEAGEPRSTREIHLREQKQNQKTHRDFDDDYKDNEDEDQGLCTNVRMRATKAGNSHAHYQLQNSSSCDTWNRSGQVDQNNKQQTYRIRIRLIV